MLLDSLDRRRFEPILLTWIDAGQEYQPASKKYEWLRHVRKHKLDFGPLWFAKRLIRDRKISLVHGMLDTGNFYGGLLKLFSRNLVFVASERSSKRKLSRFQTIHKAPMHRIADITIANSEQGKDFVSSMGVKEDCLTFIPNGLDTDRFSPVEESQKEKLRKQLFGFDCNRKVLLSVGSIYETKNQLGLVHAFADAALQDTRLVLVGKPKLDYLDQVKNAINQRQVNDKVDIFPPTSNVDKLYKSSDGLVLNSKFEGTPNVVLEGMSSGLPVIATNVGDVSRYVDDGFGWLVNAEIHEQMVSALSAFDQCSLDQLGFMGVQARKAIEDCGLSKEKLAERHEALYLELLGRPN